MEAMAFQTAAVFRSLALPGAEPTNRECSEDEGRAYQVAERRASQSETFVLGWSATRKRWKRWKQCIKLITHCLKLSICIICTTWTWHVDILCQENARGWHRRSQDQSRGCRGLEIWRADILFRAASSIFSFHFGPLRTGGQSPKKSSIAQKQRLDRVHRAQTALVKDYNKATLKY